MAGTFLKQFQRNACSAWSPCAEWSNYIAVATAAGSIGDFGTHTEVEIVSLTTNDPQDIFMPVVGSAEAPERFHALVWGQMPHGSAFTHGIIAGGMANGKVVLYDPAALISARQEKVAQLVTTEKHSGPVQALDFNTNQLNLLASGGPNSEILIWDVANPAVPRTYTPGAKATQQGDITKVEWNKKVQHILASASYNGVTVVWDLRAKKPVITFADQSRKYKCRAMAWNPSEATQIATASEEDVSPIIQLWDLRNTYSPSKQLEGHTKGIWSLSWSPMDSTLLLSCGKGNEVFCWNTETAKPRCQVETTNSWNSQVQWSPIVPALLSTCSLEGQMKIFSLQDPAPKSSSRGSTSRNIDLSLPPKWLKTPVGAAFGFGGKLLTFGSKSEGPRLQVKDVVTDPSFVERAKYLEEAIKQDNCKSYCDAKAKESHSEQEQAEWSFMRVLFESSARTQLLAHLGFGTEEINKKVLEFIARLPEKPADEGTNEIPEAVAELEPYPEEKAKEKEEVEPDSGVEATSPEETKEEDASSLFSESTKPAEAEDVSGLFGSADGTSEGLVFGSANADDPFAALSKPEDKISFPVGVAPSMPVPVTTAASLANKRLASIRFNLDDEENPESVITRSLIVGNFEAAVNCCLRIGKMADALVLAACGGPELWARTQETYFAQHVRPFMKLIASIVKNELHSLVAQTELKSWKATLAILCTYAKSEDFPVLCDFLANRLDEAGDSRSAILCYICAGNIDKAVNAWAGRGAQSQSAHGLLDLLEKVSIFRRAIDHNEMNDVLALKYTQYAEILATQGCLQSSLHYLSLINDPKLRSAGSAFLLDRVYRALNNPTGPAPPSPFVVESLKSEHEQIMRPAVSTPSRLAPTSTPTPTGPSAMPRPYSGGSPSSPFVPVPHSTLPSPFPAMPSAPSGPSPFPSGPPQPAIAPRPAEYPQGYPAVGTHEHPVFPPPASAPIPSATIPTPSHEPFVPSRTPDQNHAGGITMLDPTRPRELPPPALQSPSPPVPASAPAPGVPAVTPPAPPAVEAKPTPVRQPTQLGQTVASKLRTVVNTLSHRVKEDPRKSRAITDAAGRLEELYEKLSSGGYADELEALLMDLAEALEADNKAQVLKVHKAMNVHWEAIGSKVMLGLKRLVDTATQ